MTIHAASGAIYVESHPHPNVLPLVAAVPRSKETTMSAVYGNPSIRPAAMGKLWADALGTQLKKDSIWRNYLYRDDGPWELTPYRMKWRGKWRRKTYDLVGTFDGWEYGDDIHVARLGLEKAFG